MLRSKLIITKNRVRGLCPLAGRSTPHASRCVETLLNAFAVDEPQTQVVLYQPVPAEVQHY